VYIEYREQSMNISNQFYHDSIKYVYQDPDSRMVNPGPPAVKPFKIKAAEKTKKARNDIKKKQTQDDGKTPLSKLLGF
jgi:hypothetical protein